ncbi:MAG: hypothetical protein K2K80_02995 [Clostridia bacterium]|nr:hypothetical protein [Clostridia bacterium]
MKNGTDKKADKLLDAVQANVLKNTYSFQLKDRRVRVVFSDNPDATTMENALVKIAIRRIS